MGELPTGTVTFLFTDIEDSAQLWDQPTDAMRPALARLDSLFREAIERQGGCIFKTIGAAFFAAFATAPEALLAAVEIQMALSVEQWQEGMPLRVRAALHTGSAEQRGQDYYGPPLNRVARLMAAGHGGQTLLSEVTQELARDTLPPDVTLQSLGEHRLKDLGRPEIVFQALHPTLTADFPPLRSLDNPDLPNNLPQQMTSFIGREKEVAEVKALLKTSRLLTLTGTGGAGKSRISLQVAADLLDSSGDGVWLVELASLTDPALVPQAVAGVLDVREESGKSILQALSETLQAKKLLIVLDNCEHVLSTCATLATTLLRACPHLHLLATSRAPLAVSGEQTYRVAPLSLPDPKKTHTVENLSQYEAVILFLERARLVRTEFVVTNTNAPALAQLCYRLDGIPLAIELAAARIRSLSVEDINNRLDNRFRLLTGGSRTLLPHQQTLRTLVDWSYDLLTDPERTLLRRLSPFAGGWTLKAAEAISASDGTDSDGTGGVILEVWEVLDLLTGLVDKSLVVYIEQQDGARYRLLETVRQYAAERLAECGEQSRVRGRHRAFFLALADEAEQASAGPEQGAWLARMEAEIDNFRAALDDCQADPDGALDGLKLTSFLEGLWWKRGHLSEGLRVCAAALAHDRSAILTPERGRVLLAAGNICFTMSDYAAARDYYEQYLAVSRSLDLPKAVANALGSLGNVAQYQGDYPAARDYMQQSLEINRSAGNRRSEATSLTCLGSVALAMDEPTAAQDYLEEALQLCHAIGNIDLEGYIFAFLGTACEAQSDLDGARVWYAQSLEASRRSGNQGQENGALTNLANAAESVGDLETAEVFCRQSLGLARERQALDHIADGLESAGRLSQRQAQPARAATLWGAAAALRLSLGKPLSSSARNELASVEAKAKAALGAEAFRNAYAQGQAFTWEQAAEYALTE